MSSPPGAPPLLEVRPVRADEHDAVAALTVGVYVEEGYANPGYVPELRDVARRADQALQLVAVDGGRIVGVVTLALAGSPFAEQAAPGDAVVRMLVVHPAARGRRVGERLVLDCLERARAAGCTRVRLSTQPTMHAAHRLYERLGFVRTPEHDWSPVPGLDLLTYLLPLEPAA